MSQKWHGISSAQVKHSLSRRLIERLTRGDMRASVFSTKVTKLFSGCCHYEFCLSGVTKGVGWWCYEVKKTAYGGSRGGWMGQQNIGQRRPLLVSCQRWSLSAKNVVVPFPHSSVYYCNHDNEGSLLVRRGCSDVQAEAMTQRIHGEKDMMPIHMVDGGGELHNYHKTNVLLEFFLIKQ